jgi:DNA-binding IclR family transcriptional regulator
MTNSDLRRYKAPALEKGLDVLELLALASQPLTMTEITKGLGRSHGELFRMLQVLQFRGYIEQDLRSDAYVLTDKLFSLGMHQPRTMNLVELALPEMRKLATDSGQSCHLAFHTAGDIVVVARMESAEQLGFSVRVGYRQRLIRTTSGVVLYAFQDPAVRLRWETIMVPAPPLEELEKFRQRADKVRIAGIESAKSPFVDGVTDISAPIMRDTTAVAALTIPFIARRDSNISEVDAKALLSATSRRISAQLFAADNRA